MVIAENTFAPPSIEERAMPNKPPLGNRPLEIRSKIWIERGEEVVLSEWRVTLLEAVDAHSSLS
jgi:hypothetical protein